MKLVPQRGSFNVGPYLGYYGQAEYDPDSASWHGEVAGVRDVVTFQGKSIDGLSAAFVKSVDDYRAFCKSRGEAPERPFSGRFVVRIRPEVHQKISTIAASSGLSLNQFVAERLEDVVQSTPSRSIAQKHPGPSKRRRKASKPARKRIQA
jgi:predicted HicB family RNase H-like nuclease